MATARTAVVEAAAPVGERARVLDLRLAGEPDADLPAFAGGKYVIVDTGVDLPNGKRAKRAYSLLACDARDPAVTRFRVAVLRLDGGPGSAALHAIECGAALTFSGPWGKHRAEPSMTGAALVF